MHHPIRTCGHIHVLLRLGLETLLSIFYDILDIVEADDPNEVAKAAMIIRANGHSSTETLLAIPWSEFLNTF